MTPLLLVCVDNPNNTLTDHAIPVSIDASIVAGAADDGCAGLRVRREGAPAPFWIEEGTCGAEATTLWVGAGVLRPGPTGFVVGTDDPLAPDGPDGNAVFPLLFDDFSGDFLDLGTWTIRGPGSAALVDGQLRTSSLLAMRSNAAVFRADDTELVARVDAIVGTGEGFEIGGGDVDVDDAGTYLWHEDRAWNGVTHMSEGSAYAMIAPGSDPTSATCTKIPWIGDPWLPTAEPRISARLAMRYGASGETTLITSTDGEITTPTSPVGCLPDPVLPVLFVLDTETVHTNPERRLDFVFVRPTAPIAPIVTVVTEPDADGDGVAAWDEGCGDADGDGIPDHADPLPTDPPPDPTTATTTATATSPNDPPPIDPSVPFGASTDPPIGGCSCAAAEASGPAEPSGFAGAIGLGIGVAGIGAAGARRGGTAAVIATRGSGSAVRRRR